MKRLAIGGCLLLAVATPGVGETASAGEAGQSAAEKPQPRVPDLALGALARPRAWGSQAFWRDLPKMQVQAPATALKHAPDHPQRPQFIKSLNREASRYSVRNPGRAGPAQLEMLENGTSEASWAARRILSRAADHYLGDLFEDWIERSQAVVNLRRSIDRYTAVRFEGGNAVLGSEVDLPEEAGKSPVDEKPRSRIRTSVRLRLDANPKILLKADFGSTRARLELPLGGSEVRLEMRRPFGPRVSSAFYASYPRNEGHARAGLQLFLRF